MICPKCGAEMRQDNVCPKCGYVTNVNSPPVPEQSKNPLKIISTIISVMLTILALAVSCSGIKWAHDAKNGKISFNGYAASIRSDTPTGYNMTYGQGFDRYFESTKWEDITVSGNPAVRFTGICDNGNGTYSKAEVLFGITDMNDGQFYYTMDQVVIDGVDVGTIGAYGLMEEVFGNGSPF